MRALVIPTNRPDCLREFLKAWEGKGGWDSVFVVEDGPKRSTLPPPTVPTVHYCWADMEKAVGADHWIFSRRDSAIRCFGFLAAWWAGAEYVLTLDDDCYPIQGETEWLFPMHMGTMLSHPRWVSSVPGLRVRGLPYRGEWLPGVVANVGLWTNHPDIDAVMSLDLLSRGARPSYNLSPRRNWLVPRGQYAPLCGMNLCFKREAIPLFYFPLMGQGQPYSRFDDIWAGVIAKRVADHLGWSISVGEPFVEHRKASDPFVNLKKEAPGIAANETFWHTIDAIPLTARDAFGAVYQVGCDLNHNPDPYLKRLGEALRVWVRLLTERPAGL